MLAGLDIDLVIRNY